MERRKSECPDLVKRMRETTRTLEQVHTRRPKQGACRKEKVEVRRQGVFILRRPRGRPPSLSITLDSSGEL